MGLVNQIMAGENEGRTARHEFVVVGFKSLNSVNNQWKTNLPPLHYTVADAEGMYRVLTSKKYGFFLKENVKILINEEASTHNIKKTRSSAGFFIRQLLSLSFLRVYREAKRLSLK